MTNVEKARRAVLRALPTRESQFVVTSLREETVGGGLLLVAAVLAVVWASSPVADSYEDLRDVVIGPATLHLDLTLQEWAADGLLAIFFFVAGLELKRELVVGHLRHFSEAMLPVVAAICGMAMPALLYLMVAWRDPEAVRGWAVPIATDIAFALAVLAVIGSALPTALRAFLLTLAVVDDLGAILVIALAYPSSIRPWSLAVAAIGVGLYAWFQHRGVHTGWLLVPLAVLVWALVHDSGIHATVAGVALGLLTRVRPRVGETQSPAERLEHRLRPVSAGLAVPVFALMSAGVPFDPSSLGDALRDTAAVAVIVGLVVGKLVGVLGGTWLTVKLTRAELNPDIGWPDIGAVALLAGIGFTVSLLIADLAFAAENADRAGNVKTAILLASLLSAALASVLLRMRQRRYQRVGSPRGGAD